MNGPWDLPLSGEELDKIKQLEDIEVVMDVGARTSLDYIEIFPNATHHLFEPNPEFVVWLIEECKDKPNVFINKYGLGNKAGNLLYHSGIQAFDGGECSLPSQAGRLLAIKTLDWYVKKYEIKKIDFLKIDTEGYDFKVLLGGKKAIDMCRYIQYEQWDNKEQFHDLLQNNFEMTYIGERNVLCKRIK